jgi:hypothetical protein
MLLKSFEFRSFPDGVKVEYTMPELQMDGMVFGDRYVNWTGKLLVEDTANKLSACVTFNPGQQNSGWFSSRATPGALRKDCFTGLVLKAGEEISQITGSWMDHIMFDNQVYWKIRQFKPFVPLKAEAKFVLPSDSRFRSDISSLKEGDLEQSQYNKAMIEEAQRADRKLRAHHSR